MGKIAAWLFENAKEMKEGMFLDSSVDWSGLKPFHLLALRACTPDGVFTEKAKGGYLTQVGKGTALAEMTNWLFADDYEFVTSLPVEWQKLRAQLIPLMQMAYRYRIRPTDSRVKSM